MRVKIAGVLAVFEGFWTIGAVIAVGWFLAARNLVPDHTVEALSRVTFTLATPVLLFTVIADAPVARVLSAHLVITLAAALAVAGIYIALATRWGRDPGERIIGGFAAGYANSNNLGLPIAVYVLGDAVYVTPVVLGQLLILQPLGLALLDLADPDAGGSRIRRVFAPLRNPMTIASLLGLLAAATGWAIPQGWGGPVDLIAGMAVPAILLAYGMSLRWGPTPFVGGVNRDLYATVALKMLGMPLIALVLGSLWGLSGPALLAVVVTAALPSGQNVFLIATIYRRGVTLARDAVFASTLLSLPIILGIVALLG